MKKLLLTTFLFLIYQLNYGQNNCEKYIQDYIPTDLNDAISYFECKSTKDALADFQKKNEREAVGSLHFGAGLSIRNNWELWAGTSKLSKYFRDLGIYHPDDMSSIILISLHRKLNGVEIDLDSQIRYYKEFWAEVERKETEKKQLEFNEFKIGDAVEFSYNYDFVSKRQEEKWFNDKCNATGIIKDLNPEKFEIRVKLKKSCDRKGIVILRYDVYDKVDGEFQKVEENKINILKKGETQWTSYDLWSIVEK